MTIRFYYYPASKTHAPDLIDEYPVSTDILFLFLAGKCSTFRYVCLCSPSNNLFIALSAFLFQTWSVSSLPLQYYYRPPYLNLVFIFIFYRSLNLSLLLPHHQKNDFWIFIAFAFWAYCPFGFELSSILIRTCKLI